MLRRLLTSLLAGALVAALALLGLAAPASAAPVSAAPVSAAPVSAAQGPEAAECPEVTVPDSSKGARAVFSGTVTAVERQPRTDGLPGAIYLQTVTVGLVYRGPITTETVQVQTDRNRGFCSLGALVTGTEYMFFVAGNGEPWVAAGTSGTRPDDPAVTAEVEQLLGTGEPPIDPAPEPAIFTPVETDEPTPLSRTAAPGAALVIVGLLGLLVVGAVRRRR